MRTLCSTITTKHHVDNDDGDHDDCQMRDLLFVICCYSNKILVLFAFAKQSMFVCCSFFVHLLIVANVYMIFVHL